MDFSNSTPPEERPPLKLPELRKGVTIEFSDYDRDGKPQWLIHDAGRNKFFIIGWMEYEILKRWPLGDSRKITEDVNNQTTLDIEEHDIENLLRFLAHNFLIKQSATEIYQRAKDQKLFKKDNLLYWLISYYLFFKIPLFHPDKFLTRTKIIGEILFNRITFYLMLIITAIALYQLSTQWEKFTHTFPSIFTWYGLFLYFIAYMICKLLHELGHAYMCKQYGVPVPTLGIAFLVFWPVLYTDTTLSWSLKNEQRLRIALAGIWVETYVTIIAAILWCNVDNLTIQSICYITITINWLASLLINVSPFMRFDGYYVLADYLKMPNLQPRAFALTRWQIRHWLFHWQEQPPERFSRKMHFFLVFYSIITWLYRLIIYFGIAILVYHFFVKAIGILLFIIELFYFILSPIVAEIQNWLAFKEKFTLNKRTKITIFVSLFIFFMFLMPISNTIKLPGTLGYAHQFLISPAEGILKSKLPPIGTKIKAGESIIEIQSPELNQALQETKLEYDKLLTQLRRSSIDPNFTAEKTVLLSNISKQQAKYKKLMDLRSQLLLKVPFDGIIIDIENELSPGTNIKDNEWLGDVVDPTIIQAEAYVSQIDFNNIKVGLTGYFYPHDLSIPPIPVIITTIEVLNSTKLMCHYSTEIKQDKRTNQVVETPCYNISDLGGDIAATMGDDGEYIPVNSVFRVLLKTEKMVKLDRVERGTIVIDTGNRSYASRLLYILKTNIIKEAGF